MSPAVKLSLPSMAALLAIPLLFGVVLVGVFDVPVWVPAALGIIVLTTQFVVGPWFVQWLIPATKVDRTAGGYDTDHPVGEIVAARCRQAGVPLVRLGIVKDGNPNAFTFGHTPRDARIYLTTGLLERLDDDELNAVVAHEVGHIKNWDFVVMTLAGVIPMTLYYLYLTTRAGGKEGQAVALSALVAYMISSFFVLALNRARERAADHWSCEATGNGDALASALVRIAYGMGEEHLRHTDELKKLTKAKDKSGARRERRAHNRATSMRVMGIFEPKAGETMAAAVDAGLEPDRVIGALRWDLANPWARIEELMASHPLVAHRIESLERSGLPGAPRRWSVAGIRAEENTAAVRHAWAAFVPELVIRVVPRALFAAVWVGLWFGFLSVRLAGALLVAAGLLFLVKQVLRYPVRHRPVAEIAGLLERLDAGPVTGIAVELRGKIIGRGTPGFVLSPDLVLRDRSGFVPLLYQQPIPFAREWFGLAEASDLIDTDGTGADVVARGWYRRMPAPVVELRSLKSAAGKRVNTYWWIAAFATSALTAVVGLLMATSSIS